VPVVGLVYTGGALTSKFQVATEIAFASSGFRAWYEKAAAAAAIMYVLRFAILTILSKTDRDIPLEYNERVQNP
jgi:uncharacterized membrane protein YhdT